MKIRKSTFNRVYCFDCGTPWTDEEEILCQRCGSGQKSFLRAKPLQRTDDEQTFFSFPWDDIPWPEQGTVAMYGGPGTGKSSLSSLIRPKWWLTKEQEPKPASSMFRRTTPGHMPEIVALDTAEEVAHTLMDIKEGPIVIDSLTAFGLKESLQIAHIIVNWSRETGQKALAILQANQGGGAAGYLEIPHLFDAVINVEHDPWGVRVFRIEKSRWCGLGSTYFTFNDQGGIVRPQFPASYTVEGSSGGYYLHPFPVKGSKWGGLFLASQELGTLTMGLASCAQIAPYMPKGFIEPMDVQERIRFAKKAGLKWYTPDDFADQALNIDTDENQTPNQTPNQGD